MGVRIVEKYEVSPSQGAVAEQLLPLLHFDMVWLPSPLIENLLFYKFQCSEPHFLATIVPNLKKSLSLTLKYFPPVAGDFVFPLNSGMPVCHYVAGKDSLPLTIAVSDADFVNLMGNHLKDADEFLGCVPQMPPATYSSDRIKFSALSIQVTLFPNQGICIGFSHNHAIGDGATMIAFLRTWSSINKHSGDAEFLALGEKVLPFYDRSMVQDADRLTKVAWNTVKKFRPTVRSTKPVPTNKFRGMFLLSVGEIEKLKNFLPNKKPAASSYAVVCGYVWSCLAKAAAAAGEDVADDEPEYFKLPADCRAKLSPPLPQSYFGNCQAVLLAQSTHGRLKGNEGFATAAQEIAEAIGKAFEDEGRISDCSEEWLLRPLELIGKRVYIVGGSPRFNLYRAGDFGWGGGPCKFEMNFDYDDAVTMCMSKKGGFSIVLSLGKLKMNAFAEIFNQGLQHVINTKL